MLAFLASPAGDYVTGTTIVVDGGLDVSGPGSPRVRLTRRRRCRP